MKKKTDTFVKMTAAVMIFVLIFALCACGQETAQKAETAAQAETEVNADPGAKRHAEINIKGYGTIKVELEPEVAPITVDNFVELAQAGFYNGLTFHRIIKDFMIQGGDPLGTGTGGSEKKIKGEFAQNGVENPLSHTRGAISMARSQRMDSASSQFFIVHKDSKYLDGSYAVFGYVTEGIEIVDKICDDIPVQDRNGTVLASDQPVIESIVITD